MELRDLVAMMLCERSPTRNALSKDESLFNLQKSAQKKKKLKNI
jgi:hypothetical protein